MTGVLCIDAGNSRVKVAVMERGRVRREWALPTQELRSNPERVWRRSVGEVEGAIISSVTPTLNRRLARAVTARVGRPPLFVDHTIRLPFELRVENPAALGADRICAAAGAVGGRRRHAIVIDVGSAITVDLVEAGRYRGGPIMAGPAINLRALATFAERLPSVGLDKPHRASHGGTEASMRLGATLAATGGLREAVRYLERSAGRRIPKIVTGGGLGALHGKLPVGWEVRPHLVLEGLSRLWALNQ